MAAQKPERRCPAGPFDTAGQPIWLQLRERIRAAVVSGQWQPGDALLPTRQMCARLGLNRVTIDLAIRDLIREGLLFSRHGTGTFVADRTPPSVLILSFEREGRLDNPRSLYLRCEQLTRAGLAQANIHSHVLYRGRTKADGMHGPQIDAIRAHLQRHPADAFLTIGIQEDTYLRDFVATVAQHRPVVAIDAAPLSTAFDAVAFDSFRAGFLVGRHLAALAAPPARSDRPAPRAILFIGHDRLAALGNPAGKQRIPEPDSVRNLAGLRYALDSYTEPPIPVHVLPFFPDPGPALTQLHADLAARRFSAAVLTLEDAQRLQQQNALPSGLEVIVINAAVNDPEAQTFGRIEWDPQPLAAHAVKRLIERLAPRTTPATPATAAPSALQLLIAPAFHPRPSLPPA